jgi:hypothetical protein
MTVKRRLYIDEVRTAFPKNKKPHKGAEGNAFHLRTSGLLLLCRVSGAAASFNFQTEIG